MLKSKALNSSLNDVLLGQVRGASNISYTLLNGKLPVASTYIVTPRDHTSQAVELISSFELIVSGDR